MVHRTTFRKTYVIYVNCIGLSLLKKVLFGIVIFLLICVYMLIQTTFMQDSDMSLDLSLLTSNEKQEKQEHVHTQENKTKDVQAQVQVDSQIQETKKEKKALIVNDSSIEGSITFSNNLQNSEEEILVKIPVSEIKKQQDSELVTAEEKEEILDIEHIQEIIESPQNALDENKLAWREIDKGLDYVNKKEKFFLDKLALDVDVHIIRINTAYHEIDLYGSFIDQSESKSVRSWALDKGLQVAINASMYLPDNKTSNGYMRSGADINNGKMAEKMNGFFFSKSKKEGIVQSSIEENLNQSDEESRNKLDEYLDSYEVVIQNFRILGNYSEDTQECELLWEQDENKFSIASYGEDIEGNIYFIFSRAPLSVFEFGSYILSLSSEGLSLNSLLYAEGGSEAGLYLKTSENQYFIAGIVRNTPFSNIAMAVPNVLGVRKKVQ